MDMKIIRNVLLAFSLIAIVAACDGKNAADNEAVNDNIFNEAVFIKGVPRGDDVMEVTVVNPWDTSAVLAEYLLVNPGTQAPGGGAATLQLPLKRLVVYSAVHAALLAELGHADAIVGVADGDYIKTPAIVERIKDGRIADIGSSMEPSLERLISLKPDAVLISPFQNAGHGVVDKAGVPVVECADYMELTPLGRAEWSKFYAMLVEGIAPSNSRVFDQSRLRYNRLVEKAAAYDDKPKVITELQNKGTWLMPGGCSYAGRMLLDAGATYPFAGNKSPGSIPMNYEKAFMASQDADFWLLKSFGEDPTLEDIARNHPLNKRIWAYNNKGIYNANTARVNLYEETPFHPERLLADYVAIFHQTGDTLRYFSPVR